MGKGIGTFELPENGQGRIHYTPADTNDAKWMSFRKKVQSAVNSVYSEFKDKVKLATCQTAESWPCISEEAKFIDSSTCLVYVNTIGPRFETLAEINAYRPIGHVVGMTCAREWALCEELCTPYCLICFCD